MRLKMKLTGKDLEKIEAKFIKVIRSCTTKDQLKTAEQWCDNVLNSTWERLTFATQIISDLYYMPYIREQQKYLERLNETK